MMMRHVKLSSKKNYWFADKVILHWYIFWKDYPTLCDNNLKDMLNASLGYLPPTPTSFPILSDEFTRSFH